MFVKKFLVWIVCVCVFLTSCVTPGQSTRVGPKFSSQVVEKIQKNIASSQIRLDIVVPVFDPGIPETAKEQEEDMIWPELRRAEANRFALKLKEAIEKTGKFGAVRVTPDANAAGDLYVIGKIVESNGEEVEIDIEVLDITGKQLYDESYDHEVPEKFHKNIRNKNKDPYQPVFEEAAADLVELLNDQSNTELALLQSLTEMRFAANFSEDAFAEHLMEEDGNYKLISLPSDDDPMLKRIRSIRIRDQLYIDNIQSHYEEFDAKMSKSYAAWQEQSMQEVKAMRAAKYKQAGKVVLGVLAFALMIGLAAAGGNSNNFGNSAAAETGAIVAGVGGAALIASSFRSSKEAEFHRETIEELGESIDIDLGPQVVEFEEKTKKITGDAAEQFSEWRAFLKEIYNQEKTPLKQL